MAARLMLKVPQRLHHGCITCGRSAGVEESGAKEQESTPASLAAAAALQLAQEAAAPPLRSAAGSSRPLEDCDIAPCRLPPPPGLARCCAGRVPPRVAAAGKLRAESAARESRADAVRACGWLRASFAGCSATSRETARRPAAAIQAVAAGRRSGLHGVWHGRACFACDAALARLCCRVVRPSGEMKGEGCSHRRQKRARDGGAWISGLRCRAGRALAASGPGARGLARAWMPALFTRAAGLWRPGAVVSWCPGAGPPSSAGGCSSSARLPSSALSSPSSRTAPWHWSCPRLCACAKIARQPAAPRLLLTE